MDHWAGGNAETTAILNMMAKDNPGAEISYERRNTNIPAPFGVKCYRFKCGSDYRYIITAKGNILREFMTKDKCDQYFNHLCTGLQTLNDLKKNQDRQSIAKK